MPIGHLGRSVAFRLRPDFKVIGSYYPDHFLDKRLSFAILTDIGVDFKGPVVSL